MSARRASAGKVNSPKKRKVQSPRSLSGGTRGAYAAIREDAARYLALGSRPSATRSMLPWHVWPGYIQLHVLSAYMFHAPPRRIDVRPPTGLFFHTRERDVRAAAVDAEQAARPSTSRKFNVVILSSAHVQESRVKSGRRFLARFKVAVDSVTVVGHVPSQVTSGDSGEYANTSSRRYAPGTSAST